jgi:GH15 family glucan-1,4-alpha-glucosidase
MKKHAPGAIGCYARPQERPLSFRSCTGLAGNAASLSTTFHGCRDTSNRARFASGTRHTTSCSSMCSVKSWMRFTRARRGALHPREADWAFQRALVEHLEGIWNQPDEGIWEVRGARRHFVHSKVMAWVALDRGIRAVESFGLEGPVSRWRTLRQSIHDEVCTRGFDPQLGSFVQSYGSRELDASLLLLPTMGFLPARDPRIRGTVEAVERRLFVDGFLLRYDTATSNDGLPAGEGAFLACSFWLVDAYLLIGRLRDARRLFEKLLSLRNDVGLLAEEYDTRAQRLVGNFPQACSHVALVNSAHNLARATKPAEQRSAS